MTMTSMDVPSHSRHLTQHEVTGYENMKKLLIELDAENIHTDQIVLLFTASEALPADNITDYKLTRSRQTWSKDCDIFEEVVNLLQSQVMYPAPIGWLIKVRITKEEWNSCNCPYKCNEDLGLRELPTMIVHNTMKRISGRKAFNADNIIIMLED